MDLLLIVVAGTLIAALIFASPYIGLLLYLGFIYLRPPDVYPALAPYHVTRVVALLLLVSFFFRTFSTRGRKESVPIQTSLFVGWLLLIILSAIPGWWQYSLEYFYEMLKIFLAFYLITKIVDTESRFRGLVWTLLLLNAVLAFDAVLTYFGLSGMTRIGGFSGAYFGNAGDFAAMINLMVPIAFMLLWAEKKLLPKLGALLCLILLVGAIVASQARSAGILSLAVVICVLVLLSRKSTIKGFKSGSIIISILLLAVVIFLGSSAFWTRISTSFDLSQQNAVHRIELMKAGGRMFVSSPLLGIGVGMFKDRVLEFSNWIELKDYTVHNIFILAAAELGIGGVICLVLLIYYSIRDSWSTYAKLSIQNPNLWSCSIALGILVAVLAFPIVGMFQVILYYPPPYFLIGLAVAQKRLVERQGILKESRSAPELPHYARPKEAVPSGRLAQRLGAIQQQETS